MLQNVTPEHIGQEKWYTMQQSSHGGLQPRTLWLHGMYGSYSAMKMLLKKKLIQYYETQYHNSQV